MKCYSRLFLFGVLLIVFISPASVIGSAIKQSMPLPHETSRPTIIINASSARQKRLLIRRNRRHYIPPRLLPVKLSAAPVVGDTFTASNGTWTGHPTFTYQWYDCDSDGQTCTAIGGATSPSYTVVTGDEGFALVVIVTATNAGGSISASSPPTGIVIGGSGSVPVNVILPAITGAPTVGQTLSASNGTWTGLPTSYAYSWSQCNTSGSGCVVTGNNSSTYPLTSSDQGYTLEVTVVATNSFGSAAATSAPTGSVGGGGSSGPLCSPSPCTSGSLSSYSVSANDGQGTNETDTFQLSVPTNMVVSGPSASTHKVPLVFIFRSACGPKNSGSLCSEWVTNSGPDSYDIVYYPVQTSYGGVSYTGNSYATPSESHSTSVGTQTCGGHTCDDIPAIQKVLQSVECVGALPCANVDPSKIYFAGGSGGGAGVLDVMCDERTSALGAAYLVESNSLIAPTATSGASPNCPALGQQCLWAASCTGSTNTHTRVLFVYGTNDTVYSGPGCAASTTHNCEGIGFNEGNGTWFDGVEQLAGCTSAVCAPPAGTTNTGGAANIIGGFLGCSAAPNTTTTFGSTGQLIYRDHTTCSNGAETAVIAATGGPHLPQGYDGLDVPAQGWTFFDQTPSSSPSIPSNTVAPVISGTVATGNTLTTTTGTWTNSPTGYTYQWNDCNQFGLSCSAISGATSSSHVITSGEVGHTIEVTVTATNAAGSANASSSPTIVVPGGSSVPVNTAAPIISGSPIVGQTLSTTAGTWTNSPTSFGYQWEDCNSSGVSCSTISSATASSYRIVSGDTGHTIQVAVTATNSAGSGSATSTTTSVVQTNVGSLTFQDTFAGGASSSISTQIAPMTGPQCANTGTASSGHRWRGNLYIGTTTSFGVPSTGLTSPYVAKIVNAPPSGTGYTLDQCEMHEPVYTIPTGNFYAGIMVYVPSGWTIPSGSYDGDEVFELPFQNIYGSAVSVIMHGNEVITNDSAPNGPGNAHVTIGIESGPCAGFQQPCQYRSNADNQACRSSSTVACLPGAYVIPPAGVRGSSGLPTGQWVEMIVGIDLEGEANGSVHSWYKVKGASTWNTGDSITGIPTEQWNAGSSPSPSGTSYIQSYEAAPIGSSNTIYLDNYAEGTSLSAVESSMP